MLSTTSAGEIRVMISGGFAAAYGELVSKFEDATGYTVVTARGASLGSAPSSIPSRLERGEPADLLILVGEAFEALAAQKRVAPTTRVDLARSSIGMAVRAGVPKPGISSVDAFKRAMLAAKSIAYSASASGIYLCEQLFPRLGIAAEMKSKSTMIEGEPVGTAVARGAAEIALQQVSELVAVPGIDFVAPLPTEIQKTTVFCAAVAANSRQPDGARALITFLASSVAAPVIANHALEPVVAS